MHNLSSGEIKELSTQNSKTSENILNKEGEINTFSDEEILREFETGELL